MHARVTRAADGCYLSDNGSTNGTFLNGVRITEPQELYNGMVVSLSADWRLDASLPYVYVYDENAPAPVIAQDAEFEAVFQTFREEAPAVVPPFVARLPVEALAAPEPLLDRLKEQTSCGVCFDTMVAPHVLSCGHNFCGECIFIWLRRQGKSTCPSCRDDASQPAYNKIVDDLLQATLVPMMTDEQKAERAEREERWHVAKNTFAKKRPREDVTNPMMGLILPQILRAVVRRHHVHAVPPQVPPPSDEARRLRDRAIQIVNASTSAGRAAVFYSTGGAARTTGRGCDRARCLRCREPIDIGTPCASTNRGRNVYHARCAPFGRLPTGLEKLRCEDSSFIFTVGPDGPTDLLHEL